MVVSNITLLTLSSGQQHTAEKAESWELGMHMHKS